MPTPLFTHSRILALSILITSCFSTAQAQENKTSAITTNQVKSKDKPQQVEVKAKSEVENARQDTAAKTVITNEELNRYGDTNINDAMKRVPGVQVVKDQLQLPGMSSGYTQILIDGEPPRGVTIADLPMNIIDRVEIYRSGNAQFSSQAIAGTINIILKRVPSNKQTQLKINITNAYHPAGGFEWLNSDKFDRLSYSLSIAAKDNSGLISRSSHSTHEFYDDENRLTQKYTQRYSTELGNHTFRIIPRLQYLTEHGHNFTFTSTLAKHQMQKVDENDYNFILGDTLPIGKNLQDFRRSTNFWITNLRALSTLGDLKFDINAGTTLITNRVKSLDHTFTVQGIANFDREVDTHRKTRTFRNSGKITAPSNQEHEIVGGWTIFSSFDDSRRAETQWNKLAISNTDSTTNDFQTTRVAINNLALFIQDEWKFRKQSSAYFGLRWESVKVQSEGTVQEKLQHQSHVLSPVVQTLWQLDPENTDRLRFGLSRSFQAPSVFQLSSPIDKTLNNSILSPNFRGNPALRPELSWSLDAAYEHNDKDNWNYTVRSKLRSISGLHRQSVSCYADAWWMSTINAGNAISKSLEFETQFPLERLIENAPNIDISFDLNKIWSSVSYLPAPDNILSPNTFNAKFSMDFRAKELPLTLGYNIRYSDHHWQQISSSERSFQPTPTAIDLYAAWKFDQKTLLRMSIDNLQKRQSLNFSEQRVSGFHTLSRFYFPEYRKVALNIEHQF